MFSKVVDWVFDLFTLVQTFHGTSLRLYVSTQKKFFDIFWNKGEGMRSQYQRKQLIFKLYN